MPMFIVRSLAGSWSSGRFVAGQWDSGQFIQAANADEAEAAWRNQRDLPRDHPVVVERDEMEYPVDEELEDGKPM